MSDDTGTQQTEGTQQQTQQSEADEALVQEASSMGWVDKDSYQGAPEKWVDAKTFVDRGKHILPILNKNNERLKDEVRQRDQRIQDLEREVSGVRESVGAMREFHVAEVKRRTEETRKRLLADLKGAKTSGNVDEEVRITDELSQLPTADDLEGEEESTSSQQRQQQARSNGDGRSNYVNEPEFQAWVKENSAWYGKDPLRTDLMHGIVQRFRAQGDRRVGRVFLDAATTELAAAMKRMGGGRQSRVLPGGQPGNRQTTVGKTFTDLPAEAQAAARRFSEQLVGKDRLYKTEAEWEAAYTKDYLAGESQ